MYSSILDMKIAPRVGSTGLIVGADFVGLIHYYHHGCAHIAFHVNVEGLTCLNLWMPTARVL